MSLASTLILKQNILQKLKISILKYLTLISTFRESDVEFKVCYYDFKSTKSAFIRKVLIKLYFLMFEMRTILRSFSLTL